jgi:hypothetical protein
MTVASSHSGLKCSIKQQQRSEAETDMWKQSAGVTKAEICGIGFRAREQVV